MEENKMDKSLEFLKMCTKAEEIQRIWKITDGDFYIIKKTGKIKPTKIHVLNDWETKSYIIDHRDYFVWIPHLDQLHEMVDWINWEIGIRKRDKLEMYYARISGEDYRGVVTGASMEQLWLAFCQKILYKKIWDGENWIEDQNNR
ncbi:MAG: hypothetical protein AB1478_08320 [Nitrospirota bacterium]